MEKKVKGRIGQEISSSRHDIKLRYIEVQYNTDIYYIP